jgi:hypothetical protein
MKSKVNLAILAIRISTVIYFLIGIVFLILAFVVPPDTEGWSKWMGFFMAGFCVPFIIFLEVLIIYLRKRKFWAWVAGLIVGALYAPSLFLPLGVMILIGLLSESSRNEFGMQKRTEPDR